MGEPREVLPLANDSRPIEHSTYPGVDQRFDGRYRAGHRAGWELCRAALSGDSRANGEPGPGTLACAYRCHFTREEHATNERIRHPFMEPSVRAAVRQGDLEAAWAEAEAALPEGWRLSVQRTDEDFEVWAATGVSPTFFDGETDDGYEDGQAETPAAALLALAPRLRALREADPS